VEHRLRPIRGFDHRVGLGKAALDVAARVRSRIREELLGADGLVGVEQRMEHLVLDVDERERRARLSGRVGRDGGDRPALVARLAGQHLQLVRLEDGAHARCLTGAREVEPRHPCPRVRRAKHRGVSMPGSARSAV
jgi:hypothetical protein